MNLWLYSHLDDSSPGNRLLTEEAEARGHRVTRIRPGDRHFNLDESLASPPDLIFARSGASAPQWTLTPLILWSQRGVPVVNSPEKLLLCRDKAVCYAVLQAHGCPVPRSLLLGREPVEEAVEGLAGPPWVLKLPVSTKGKGVMLAESLRSLRAQVDTLRSLDQPILLQEYVATARASDLRVMVLGGKARVAARRQAQKEHEFRSNVDLGGRAEGVELTARLSTTAENAAQALGLDVAGVDLLETEDGFVVIEVNGSPGLTAAPTLAEAVVGYLEERTMSWAQSGLS